MNPYTELLAQALHRLDETVTVTQHDRLCDVRLADVIHLHWAEMQVRAAGPLRTAAHIWRYWRALRGHARHLVYTVHNVDLHSDQVSWAGALAQRLVVAWARHIHVHDPLAATRLAQVYGRRDDVTIIPHGNYIGAYPNTMSRTDARAWLGVSEDAFVVATLGQLRPYKGMEDLLAAFHAWGDKQAVLIIAGHGGSPDYVRKIRSLAAWDRRVRVDVGYVPSHLIQAYLNAADYCAVPYRRATTSGAAILALSFGVPLIAPAREPFASLVAGKAGILFDPSTRDGLKHALEEAKQSDRAAASRAAWEVAQSLDWMGIARQHLTVYQSLVR